MSGGIQIIAHSPATLELQNLRAIFDNPPDIYDSYRLDQADGGKALQKAALHVIIMDEFDAMARTRGGRDGAGNQGDAGVARDSVVNQLLAKMDGVDALPVPTLVIGMTNKRSLIEPALLRPGRFEVQIEVPPPRTMEQRLSILKVHTKHMLEAGRLLVRDAPMGTIASRQSHLMTPTYEELLTTLANECEGMSGASLAGVARAAASHALERAVQGFAEELAMTGGGPTTTSIMDCLVTQQDLELAVQDVVSSSGDNDFAVVESEDSKEDAAPDPQDYSDDEEQEAG
jgi:vesicle-fusing ATPase